MIIILKKFNRKRKAHAKYVKHEKFKCQNALNFNDESPKLFAIAKC
jgi:hypothetical protein